MADDNNGEGFRRLPDNFVNKYTTEISTLMKAAAISFFDSVEFCPTAQRDTDEAKAVLGSAVRNYVRMSIIGGKPFRENRAQLREDVENALRSYIDYVRELALPSSLDDSVVLARIDRESRKATKKFVLRFLANQTTPGGITTYLVAKYTVRSYTERHNTWDDPIGLHDDENITWFIDSVNINRFADKLSVVESPADKLPVVESPADELPVGESPADELPVGEAARRIPARRTYPRIQNNVYSRDLGVRSAVSMGNVLVEELDRLVRSYIFLELLNYVFNEEQPLFVQQPSFVQQPGYASTPSPSAFDSPGFVPHSPLPLHFHAPLSPRVSVDTQQQTQQIEVYPGWLQSIMMENGSRFVDELDTPFLRLADAQRRIKEAVMDSVATYSSTPTQRAFDTWISTADERVGNAYADFMRVLHEAALPEKHDRPEDVTPTMRWVRSNRVDAVTNSVTSYVKAYDFGPNEVVTDADVLERSHGILHGMIQYIVDTHRARNLQQQAHTIYRTVFENPFRPHIVNDYSTNANELRYTGEDVVDLRATDTHRALIRAAYTYVFEDALVVECFERRHNYDRDMEVWPSIAEPSAQRRGSFSDDDMDVDDRDSVERDDDDSSQDDMEKGKERMRDW